MIIRSSDQTQVIAEDLVASYSNVRDNKGRCGAVNTGIREGKGRYFKVVDSDDWVDSRAYLKILEKLQVLEAENTPVDAFISNFVYEKEGQSRKKSMSCLKIVVLAGRMWVPSLRVST